jgi:hypothetical protein
MDADRLGSSPILLPKPGQIAPNQAQSVVEREGRITCKYAQIGPFRVRPRVSS